jgi:hypothetical protein
MRVVRPKTVGAVILVAGCAVLQGGDVLGQSITMPVLVTIDARKPVQVLVATGPTLPCDASENRPLVKGWMQPNQSARAMSTTGCVCVQHTYDDFPDVNWSTAQMVCRRGCPKGVRCTPDPNQTLWIPIRATVP